MGLFTWILSKFITGKFTGEQVGGFNVSVINGKQPHTPLTDPRTLVLRWTSYVYDCTNINSNACASVPLRLFAAKKNGQKSRFKSKPATKSQLKRIDKSHYLHRKLAKADTIEEILDHPLLDLLRNVSPYMNEFELQYLTFLGQEVVGNSYWWLLKDPTTGVPLEIWPLVPQYVKVIPDQQKFILGYEYRPPKLAMAVRFEPEEIIHFKYPSIKDPFVGMSPLEAASLAADLGVFMNQHEAAIFKEGGLQDMAMVLPVEAGTPPKEEILRLQKEWKKKYGGRKKSGKLPILSGGAQLVPVGFKPKDMAFLKGRKASLQEVAAIFGVPLSKLTTDNVNRANAEAGNYSYQKDTILPKITLNEQKINEQLTPLYDGALFVMYDNPVPEDKEFRLKQMEARLKTGETTINEERRIDGFDDVEWGDIPLIPTSLAPLGAAVDNPNTEIEPEKQRKIRKPPFEHPTNFINEPMILILRNFFAEQEKVILKQFDENRADVQILINAEKEAVNVQVESKSAIDDFVSGWFDMQIWNTRLASATDPFVRATMLAGGERALRSLTEDRVFNPLHPKVERSLANRRIGDLASVNSTTARMIRGSLAEGIVSGENVFELRKRVQAVYTSSSKFRAEMIARTETIWAWNEGARQGYEQSGVVTRLEWLASDDERTCQWCPQMDGKVISIEEDFLNKGDDFVGSEGGVLTASYDSVGHPPLHPMCRCTVIPVTEEF